MEVMYFEIKRGAAALAVLLFQVNEVGPETKAKTKRHHSDRVEVNGRRQVREQQSQADPAKKDRQFDGFILLFAWVLRRQVVRKLVRHSLFDELALQSKFQEVLHQGNHHDNQKAHEYNREEEF